jgi:pimeloyl-ACP methyl ester carboxylesterase
MAFATNGSVRLAYTVEGEGPPLLLVHGLAYCREGWGPVKARLAETHRLITFDNRGVGESDAPRGPYTVASLTADAVAVLDAAEVDRAHVVGMSLGSLVAQTLAAGSPDRVDRLVLVGSTPGGWRAHPIPRPFLLLLLQAAALDREDLLRRLVENGLSPRTLAGQPELVEEILAYRRRRAPALGPWLSQAAAGAWFGVLGSPGPIAAPTLVIHGADDKVIDPRNASLLARSIPGAELEIFEDAGHLLFWEQADRFGATVERFLARRAVAAAA